MNWCELSRADWVSDERVTTLYYQELDFVLQGKEYAKRIARSEENSRRMLLILRTRNTNCNVTIL